MSRTAGGILTVGVIAGALALLVWWAATRRPAARSTPQRDLYREIMRAHRVRPGDMPAIERAVQTGRRLADPELRAAAVAWAQGMIDMEVEQRRQHPHRTALLGLVAVLGTATWGIALIVWAWQGKWDLLLGPGTWFIIFIPLGVRTATGPRRAVRRNSGPPDAAGEGATQRE